MRVPGSNGKANAATLPHMNEPDEVALPDSAEAASAADPSRPVFIFDTRLNFLYHVVEDTQNTIRFLDTKAAFCVTLLSGMTAVALQHPQSSRGAHVLLGFFLAVVVVAVLVNLRVIFPVIRASHPTANGVTVGNSDPNIRALDLETSLPEQENNIRKGLTSQGY